MKIQHIKLGIVFNFPKIKHSSENNTLLILVETSRTTKNTQNIFCNFSGDRWTAVPNFSVGSFIEDHFRVDQLNLTYKTSSLLKTPHSILFPSFNCFKIIKKIMFLSHFLAFPPRFLLLIHTPNELNHLLKLLTKNCYYIRKYSFICDQG